MCCTGMEKWLGDNSHRIYRFLVYRKLFTPYELDKKFVDESQFEDTNYRFGFIEEAIELGNGEWLLGFREVIDDEVCNYITYLNLSDIRLFYFEKDQNMMNQDEEET